VRSIQAHPKQPFFTRCVEALGGKRQRAGKSVLKNQKNMGRFALAMAAVACTLALPVPSAAAQGIFEFLFGGGIRRSAAPPPAPLPAVRPYADPSRSIEGYRSESGPSTAYCVRLCDGHPFPVQSVSGSAAQACASMCPAAQTQLFTGGSIDHAVSSDGKRYAALPAAFVYRKQLVSGCTCNGKSSGGLVHGDAQSDPSLRAGDIVLGGHSIKSLAPSQRARLGIGYVPQGREIFPLLTVAENLETGFAPLPRAERYVPKMSIRSFRC